MAARARLSSASLPRSMGAQVAGGVSNQETSYTFDRAAWIRDLTIRIYLGANLDLELVLFLDRAGGSREPLIPDPTSEGKDHIDGDDDTYSFGAAELPVDREDSLTVSATNQNATDAFDWRLNFTEDRRGSLERQVDRVAELLEGAV